MGDYIVTNKGLVSTDELMHYAKGSEGKNHKYKSRTYKNGRWVYTYDQLNRMIGQRIETGHKYDEYAVEDQQNAKEALKVANKYTKDSILNKRSGIRTAPHAYGHNHIYEATKSRKQQTKNARDAYGVYLKNKSDSRGDIKWATKNYNSAESLKRQQTSMLGASQRKSKAYKIKAKAAYYKNKAVQWLKKFTVPMRYGSKVDTDVAFMTVKNGVSATGYKGQYYDSKQGKYVNLGKNFVKKYGL